MKPNFNFSINIWLFVFLILVSVLTGFGLCILWVIHKIKKMLGVKSLRELSKVVKTQQKFQKRMSKGGNINEMLKEIKKDPNFQRQMEELKKRFGGSI